MYRNIAENFGDVCKTEKFEKHLQAKCACQAVFVVVARQASMLDKQSLKCLPNTVCPFDRGMTNKWLILGLSLTNLAESGDLFFSVRQK